MEHCSTVNFGRVSCDSQSFVSVHPLFRVSENVSQYYNFESLRYIFNKIIYIEHPKISVLLTFVPKLQYFTIAIKYFTHYYLFILNTHCCLGKLLTVNPLSSRLKLLGALTVFDEMFIVLQDFNVD